jgi:glucose/arabinose dehydrogenase
MRSVVALGFTLGLAIAASTPALAVITNAPERKTRQPIKVETFAAGLSHPWGMAFLPDGRVLLTERPGRMRVINKDGKLLPALQGVPPVVASGQGGLLDVALAPDFPTSNQIYFSYAEPRSGGLNGTAVARAKLAVTGDGGRLDGVEVIFRQEPASTGAMHFGSRLAFARDGNLFVTLGERSHSKAKAQDLTTHFGKVVRIRPDGSVPPDNPFVGKGSARAEIWSYGHRNPQSAAIHPATGKLWTIEHGARGGDEVNIPQAGKNYGWPVITYGRDYTFLPIGEGTAKAGMEQPIYYWDPSIAPSGMAFYTGNLFPEWKGNLFVGALAGRAVHRLVLDGDQVVAEERLLANLGERIRDVRAGPDGALWLLTDSADGRIVRMVPGP